MRQRFFHILIILTLALPFGVQAQVIEGGAGVIHVDQDPDNIIALQTQDGRLEAMVAIDNDGGNVWIYDSTLTLGSRWIQICSGGDWIGTFDGQEGTYYLDYNNHTNTPTIPTIDDTPYAASWDANNDGATKNSIYDKIEAMIDDTPFAASWDANGDGATKNAIYDEMITKMDGAATPTDNAIVRFDGATGTLVQNSGVLIDDGDNISGADEILFNASPTSPGTAEGTLFYDEVEDAMAYKNSEVDVTMQIGQELYIKVRNESGATITNGQVVYFSGTEAGGESRPLISLAQANSQATAGAVGLATHDIENNTYGFIAAFGLINGLNTSSYSAGDPLYLSETVAGSFTSTEPVAPNFSVPIGQINKVDAATGNILVAVAAGAAKTVSGDASELVFKARKGSAGTINPGEAIYISGWHVGSGTLEVELADADGVGTMPAIGIARGTITNSAAGDVVFSGPLAGLNTSSFSINDPLYISTTPGALTNIRPAGVGVLVQRVGTVARSSASNGIIQVVGAGRANDIPNEMADDVFALIDDVDNTKVAKFQLSGISASTTRTYTFQDASGTIPLTSDLHSAVTLAGTPDYISLSGQEITLGLIDLGTDMTGALDIADIDATGTPSASTYLRGDGTWSAVAGGSDEVADNLFRIVDDGDGTKKLAFEVSAITTATTRTWTIPDRAINFSSGGTFAENSHTHVKADVTDFAHASTHITAGSDEIDGDQIDIDYTPTNYTPSITPTEATNLDHLTAHLYGIDQALASGSSPTYGTDNQLPIMNAGGTDFEYTADWTYDNPAATLKMNSSTDAATSYFYMGTDDFIQKNTGGFDFAIGGVEYWWLRTNALQSSNSAGGYILQSGGSLTTPIYSRSNDTNTGVGMDAADAISLIANGQAMITAKDEGGASKIYIGDEDGISGDAATLSADDNGSYGRMFFTPHNTNRNLSFFLMPTGTSRIASIQVSTDDDVSNRGRLIMEARSGEARVWVDPNGTEPVGAEITTLSIGEDGNAGLTEIGFTYDGGSTYRFEFEPDGDFFSTGTGHWRSPSGTTAQRTQTGAGSFRWNTTDTEFEVYDGSGWVQMGTLDALADDTAPSLSADLDISGDAFAHSFTGGETIAANDLCAFDTDAGDGEVYLADADDATRSTGLLMIATEAGGDATLSDFVTYGNVSGFSGLTQGAVYYVSNTAGGITSTAPSGTGDIVRTVGYALSGSVLFFQPGSSWAVK